MKNTLFTLVEPFVSTTLEDRPNLGCASLIAANEARGISTRLIHGQTYLLEQFFLTNIDETWELIDKKQRADSIRGDSSIAEKALNEKTFKTLLPELYTKLILDKNIRTCLNRNLYHEFEKYYVMAFNAYRYWIKNGKEDIRLINNYVEKIVECPTDSIGFSIYLKRTLPFSRLIRKKIREKFPEIAMIIGGSFSPFLEEKEIKALFEQDYCDFLIIGEGEMSLPGLIQSRRSGKDYSGIKNLCYLEKGSLLLSERATINTLSELPFPSFSQFRLGHYPAPYLILPIQSSRGCSYKKCAFCSHYQVTLDTYNVYDIPQIADKIQHYKQEYDCKYFVFHDDNMPPTIIKRICESLKKKNIADVYFYGYGRLVAKFRDPKLISLMRETGFRAIAWGLESASQKVLDMMNKGIRIDDAEHILKDFHTAGILNLCFVMFGFPGETEKDAMETLHFLQKNANVISSILLDTYYPSKFSPIWNNPGKYGITFDCKQREDFSVNGGMSSKDADAFLKKSKFVLATQKTKEMPPVTDNNPSRMQIFLLGCHELYPGEKAHQMFLSETFDALFPVIPGEFYGDNASCEFQPLDITQPLRFYIKRIKISPWEKRAILLSDGAKNIGEISDIIREEFFASEKNKLHPIITFFQNFAKMNYAYFFGKRWKAPRKLKTWDNPVRV